MVVVGSFVYILIIEMLGKKLIYLLLTSLCRQDEGMCFEPELPTPTLMHNSISHSYLPSCVLLLNPPFDQCASIFLYVRKSNCIYVKSCHN